MCLSSSDNLHGPFNKLTEMSFRERSRDASHRFCGLKLVRPQNFLDFLRPNRKARKLKYSCSVCGGAELLSVWTILAVVASVSVVAQQPQRQDVGVVSAGGTGALLQLAAPVSDLSSALRKRNVKALNMGIDVTGLGQTTPVFSALELEDKAEQFTSINSDNSTITGDNQALATGFTGHHGHHAHHGGHHLGHGHHGHGKFFMYAHQPEHKHYEFGFKRGNDKHVVERYEKGGPHHHFKSKFRWHDKHGGHGERYWDYNHGPHHHHVRGDEGEITGEDSEFRGIGGHHHHDDGHYHHGDDGGHDDDDGHHHDHHGDGHHHGYSEPVPEFVQPGASFKPDSYRQRRKSSDTPSKKEYYKKPTGMEKKKFVGPKEQQLFSSPPMMLEAQPQPQSNNPDSEIAINDMLGFDPFSPPEIMKDHSSVGGIDSDAATPAYRAAPTTLTPPMSKPYFNRNSNKKMKNKYNQQPSSDNVKISSEEVPKLAFDLDSGKVFDEKTGKWFSLVAD
ncbi:hypothetical protein FHG87_013915 [Trinorchestia longiramus]|nr:hypothetical protein FHG87_013915 [Trinorchestia longiramus]